MKNLILIHLLLFSLSASAQYDYFKWQKNQHEIANATISSNSGIVCDIFNRVFYIDNNSKKIAWKYGIVLPNSSIARSNSNLIYFNDPVLVMRSSILVVAITKLNVFFIQTVLITG